MSKWAAESDEESEEEEQTSPILSPSNNNFVPPSLSSPVEGPSSSAPTPTSRPRDPNAVTGFISSIKFSTTQAEIEDFLKNAGCRVNRIEMLQDNNKRFNGKAVVHFQNPESLDICLTLDGTSFNGMTINTKVYESRGPKPSPVSRGDARGGRGSGGDRNNDRDRRDNNKRPDQRGDARRDMNRNDRPPRREKSFEKLEDSQTEEKSPASRPKLNLQPRTLPIETIGKTVVSTDIFGGGKPQDEREYEEKKKQMQTSSKDETSAPSSPVPQAESAAAVPAKEETADSLKFGELTIEVPGEHENGPDTTTSEKKSPRSRGGNRKNKEPREGGAEGDRKSPHPSRNTPKTGDRPPKERAEKTESGSVDGDNKKSERKPRDNRKSPKEGGHKGKKHANEEEAAASTPAEKKEDDDFTLIDRSQKKTKPVAPASKSAPSPAPTPTSATSKPAKSANSYAGLLSDSDEE